jgi:UDP-2-acetamido-2,6-beta-L-arabino-hexul-4-ose reductase
MAETSLTSSAQRKTVVVTGAGGFIGKNLVAWLARRPDVTLLPFDQEQSREELAAGLGRADFVFHLAGVNRPQREDEFRTGNVELTQWVCDTLLAAGNPAPVVLSSSIQAERDNPYGISKRAAEDALAHYADRGGTAIIYRLTNVFGKWCRPNYNSVVATFCHNTARGLPLAISDPANQLELVHVDDVVRAFLSELAAPPPAGVTSRVVAPTFHVTLGELAERIRSFPAMRATLQVPDFADDLTRKLYGTYLSYLPSDGFAYPLEQKCDARGCLAEFVKSAPFGQIFVSRTRPGVTRGNHYHHTKTEKFLVLHGEAVIRFRHILGGEVIEYPARGEDFQVIDIPTGYTHSIENVGSGELVTLFWVSEPFDPSRPDTEFLGVV